MTPDQLTDSPERPTLELLEAAAQIARDTLHAANPQLHWGPIIVGQPEITPRLCLAASVVADLDALTSSLQRYLLHVRARHEEAHDLDDIPW